MKEVKLSDIEFHNHPNTRYLSTMRVDGYVSGIFYPKNEDELIFTYNFLKINDIKFDIIGNGSNTLFSPLSEDYFIISTRKMAKLTTKYRNYFTFSSSMTMKQIYDNCMIYGYKGFEKLATIPGTLGGALKSNAGCFDESIFDNLVSMTILKNNEIKEIKKKKIKFSYRKTELDDCLILSAKFRLEKGRRCEKQKTYLEYLQKRIEKQPKGFSLGSIFKNPPQSSAGKLIEECGLKGKQQNDAQISPKHANFIVNNKNATYYDIMYLINLCKEKVLKKYNISLELEIKII